MNWKIFFTIWSKLGEIWCRVMHDEVMWPVCGKYQCRVCMRAYRVVWEAQAEPAAQQPQAGGIAARPRWLPSGAAR